MQFFFSRFDFGFSANRGHFTPAKPRSRPCASRNELTYSPRGVKCKHPLVHRRSSNYCRLAKIWFTKSEVAPNPKVGLFSRDSIRLFFVGLCTVGKNSNYACGEADVWAGYLSERLWIGSEKCEAGFLSLSVKNEHERKINQNRTG